MRNLISSSLSLSQPLLLRHPIPLRNGHRPRQEWVLKNNGFSQVEDEYVAAKVSRDEQALRRLVDDKFVQNSPRRRGD